jgi:hypothetical protein
MIRKLSMTAVFAALAIAVGYLLWAVPNVEGISAVTFFGGYFTGALPGMVVGAVGIGVFSFFNPLGPPLPAVLAAQILVMGLIGAAGHFWGSLNSRLCLPGLTAGMLGAGLTFLYGIAADYGFAVSQGRGDDPLPVIGAGIPFSVLHIVSNAAIFGGLGAIVGRKFRDRRWGGGRV